MMLLWADNKQTQWIRWLAFIRIRIKKNQTKQFLDERPRDIRDKSWHKSLAPVCCGWLVSPCPCPAPTVRRVSGQLTEERRMHRPGPGISWRLSPPLISRSSHRAASIPLLLRPGHYTWKRTFAKIKVSWNEGDMKLGCQRKGCLA